MQFSHLDKLTDITVLSTFPLSQYLKLKNYKASRATVSLQSGFLGRRGAWPPAGAACWPTFCRSSRRFLCDTCAKRKKNYLCMFDHPIIPLWADSR